mmetsp:Transcript_5631/g.10145  ORF Transcript_5631/g.10145 Transcript_5631/m.10145 type:complete len:328 (+) Transcript_5631:505-1488(+)
MIHIQKTTTATNRRGHDPTLVILPQRSLETHRRGPVRSDVEHRRLLILFFAVASTAVRVTDATIGCVAISLHVAISRRLDITHIVILTSITALLRPGTILLPPLPHPRGTSSRKVSPHLVLRSIVALPRQHGRDGIQPIGIVIRTLLRQTLVLHHILVRILGPPPIAHLARAIARNHLLLRQINQPPILNRTRRFDRLHRSNRPARATAPLGMHLGHHPHGTPVQCGGIGIFVVNGLAGAANGSVGEYPAEEAGDVPPGAAVEVVGLVFGSVEAGVVGFAVAAAAAVHGSVFFQFASDAGMALHRCRRRGGTLFGSLAFGCFAKVRM